MSAETKVDVLAVMDDDRKVMECAHKILPCDQMLDRHDMARAAVAELIEAADKLQRIYHLMDTDPDFIRLRAALSRIGGAK